MNLSFRRQQSWGSPLIETLTFYETEHEVEKSNIKASFFHNNALTRPGYYEDC